MKNLKLIAAILFTLVFPVLGYADQLAVIIISPLPGFVTTKTPTLNFSTTGENNVVKIDEGTPIPIISGTSIGPLEEGTHTVRVDSSDTAGNSGFAEVTITVDTIPPNIGSPPIPPLKISARNHNLELKSDGTIWSWGDNTNGQLGDGTSASRTIPVQIGKESIWSDVAAGGSDVAAEGSHSLAVRSDGTLWAWGDNGNGQLGDGTSKSQKTPARIGVGTEWAAVAAGKKHSLALKKDGTLWAWGNNDHGQLGTGTNSSATTPTQVGNVDTIWISIAAGARHSVAVKSDGSFWAWGDNEDGQLGSGNNLPVTSPTQVGSDTDWSAAAAGGYHTVAMKQDGRLFAWGKNNYGQVGDGSVENRTIPAQVGSGPDWSAVSAGSYHTIGLKKTGTLWGWGKNDSGQLVEGAALNLTLPIQIGDDALWTMVAAGVEHSLAVKKDQNIPATGSPVITGINPNVLFVGSTMLVTITGQNLLSAESVTSNNGLVSITILTITDTRITARMTALSAGSDTIKVTTRNGTPNTAEAGITLTSSKLTFTPGQLAIAPGTHGTMTVNVSPPIATSLTINLNNSNPSIANAPQLVTIPASGSAEFPVYGLQAGVATVDAGGPRCVVFVDSPFSGDVSGLRSGSVSVYIDAPSGTSPSAAKPVSVSIDAPSGTSPSIAKPVSVYIDAPSGTSPSTAKPVSVYIDAPAGESPGTSSPVSVFIDAPVGTSPTVAGAVSVKVQ